MKKILWTFYRKILSNLFQPQASKPDQKQKHIKSIRPATTTTKIIVNLTRTETLFGSSSSKIRLPSPMQNSNWNSTIECFVRLFETSDTVREKLVT